MRNSLYFCDVFNPLDKLSLLSGLPPDYIRFSHRPTSSVFGVSGNMSTGRT